MVADVVFLLDVDNTLLDSDRVVADLRFHLKQAFGCASAQHYWAIFDTLREELGYVDYLGALQRYRSEVEHEGADAQHLLLMSSFLIDYPFAERLYPRALDVLSHLGRFGPTVILSDGDVVFQPRKIQRAGLWDAVDGRVLVYVHKEQMLEDIQRHYPARHYVMVDDKLRLLSAVKTAWRDRVTTVFVRQGHYALNARAVAAHPAADFTIERIDELATVDLAPLLEGSHASRALVERVDVSQALQQARTA